MSLLSNLGSVADSEKPRRRCEQCGTSFNPLSTGDLCPRCLVAQVLKDGLEPDSPTPRSAGDPASLGWFGEFELLEELGHGGAGVVYRARQAGVGRLVALKILRPGKLFSAMEVERFQREAQTIARLEHPGILPLYAAGERQGQPWLSVRFMPGGSLAQAIARREPWLQDPKRVAQVMSDLSEAIHHAHQRGVLHRDLKPGNILLDESGGVCVGDFGLALMMDEESGLTRTGAFFGSPAYTSPEQAARGEGDVTIAADIHGLGAILYDLLAGQPPYAGRDPLDTLRRVLEEEPVRPSAVHARRSGKAAQGSGGTNGRSVVDRDLETICMKCLEKDPDDRLPSAAIVADSLARLRA